jgi:hypothetical protein
MMGIMVPETCRASNKICIKNSSSWHVLSTMHGQSNIKFVYSRFNTVTRYRTFLAKKRPVTLQKFIFLWKTSLPERTLRNLRQERLLTAEIQNMKTINKETTSEVLLYASNCKLAVIR